MDCANASSADALSASQLGPDPLALLDVPAGQLDSRLCSRVLASGVREEPPVPAVEVLVSSLRRTSSKTAESRQGPSEQAENSEVIDVSGREVSDFADSRGKSTRIVEN